MGDPRKHRKTYSNPKKPWDKARLDSEVSLVKEYGIVNKRELHKMNSLLRKFSLQAKKLLASSSKQADAERKSLISKLTSLSLIGANAQLDDVLALQLKNIMERRLQTVVYRKGLANTVKQARQFIVHQHVKIGNKSITSPSYLVPKEEEDKITFLEGSSLANPSHPERPEQVKMAKDALKKVKLVSKMEEVAPEPKAEEVKSE